MHWGGGHLIPKSQIQSDHCTHGWRVRAYVQGLAERGLTLNETSRDKHVGDIEQSIHTKKEHMRAIYNTLPFQKIPAQLVIEMTKTAMFWLNAFPVMGGASQDLSPHTIQTCQQVDYKHHCRFQSENTHTPMRSTITP